MAKQYRVTPMIRLINGIMGGLVRRGAGVHSEPGC
jgi:hypothetical protein